MHNIIPPSTICIDFFCAIFFILFISNSLAQKAFNPGYIITNNHDTISGLIRNNNYWHNAQYCEFKITESDSAKRYYPGEITGYRFIPGKYYITRTLDGKELFAEYLVKGSLEFFFYQDKYKTNHYYVSKDTIDPVELIYIDEIRQVDGKNYFYVKKPLIGVLTYLTSDCPELKRIINVIRKPSHKGLIALSKEYEKCTCPTGQCVVFEKKIPKKKYVFYDGGYNFFFSHEFGNDELSNFGFGQQFLFQSAQQSERLFFGLGFYYAGRMGDLPSVNVPFSINFLKPEQGFSPYLGYQTDLLTIMATQTLKFGVKYQKNRLGFLFNGGINTVMIFVPYGTVWSFGIMFGI